MLRQNKGGSVVWVAVGVVLLLIAFGLILYIKNKNQPVALYTGGVSASTVGETTYYYNSNQK